MTVRDLSDTHAKHRSALSLMTMKAEKGRKGEAAGYLTATLYLMPHTSGGSATLCPYSTPACREMCLAGAGMSGLPRQLAAKQRRTDLFHSDPQSFIQIIRRDVERLETICRTEGLRPAVRLNGTSDVMWERIAPEIFDLSPRTQFYDYTKIPLEHRRGLPWNYHLTFSVEGQDTLGDGIEYLRQGFSVAAVVPDGCSDRMNGALQPLGFHRPCARYINGDENDLRFRDAPRSIVLLRPKGHVRTSLMFQDLQGDIMRLLT